MRGQSQKMWTNSITRTHTHIWSWHIFLVGPVQADVTHNVQQLLAELYKFSTCETAQQTCSGLCWWHRMTAALCWLTPCRVRCHSSAFYSKDITNWLPCWRLSLSNNTVWFVGPDIPNHLCCNLIWSHCLLWLTCKRIRPLMDCCNNCDRRRLHCWWQQSVSTSCKRRFKQVDR